MEFDAYQEESRRTAIYPDTGKNYVYPALGLAGEAGEVCEKVKKIIRDKMPINYEVKAAITRELGDVLWYVAQLASEFDLKLDAIARENIEKLKDRQRRGVLGGSGDAR